MSKNRRGFLKKGILGSIVALLGSKSAFANKKPLPLTFKNEIPGKHPELTVLNDKPLNAEAPPHLLNDDYTPNDKFFVRNNGIMPENIDEDSWTLEIGGESVLSPKTFTLDQLKKDFKQHSYYLTLECGGNGRSGFYPPASGNQWTEGAVACSKWTGVRLKDVLEKVGLKEDAVYIGYYGADTHLSGDPTKVPISRGVPMAKALEDETLIAWAVNDSKIPLTNGYPLRLVCGGWPASTSGKWLKKIVVRNKEHDGPKMTGTSYRVPKNPVAPGQKVAIEDFKVIESMPVKSLITSPKTGGIIKKETQLHVNGHAWAGDLSVTKMEVSIDFGSSWLPCNLEKPINRLAWQQWSCDIEFPDTGYFEVWAKATDSDGKAQPMVIPGWNPKGYLNNACHRIAVKVE